MYGFVSQTLIVRVNLTLHLIAIYSTVLQYVAIFCNNIAHAMLLHGDIAHCRYCDVTIKLKYCPTLQLNPRPWSKSQAKT